MPLGGGGWEGAEIKGFGVLPEKHDGDDIEVQGYSAEGQDEDEKKEKEKEEEEEEKEEGARVT